jgi:hypothetical protein
VAPAPVASTGNKVLDAKLNHWRAFPGFSSLKKKEETRMARVEARKARLAELKRLELEQERQKEAELEALLAPYEVAAYRLVASECTKIPYLREDLKTVQMSEPAFKVVVFTKYLPVHDALVRALRDDFPAKRVMDFKGGKDCFRRDKIIREFQDTESKHLPSILVIMIKTGNVGITLTAASRVYLMEPALDPAVEVQAA